MNASNEMTIVTDASQTPASAKAMSLDEIASVFNNPLPNETTPAYTSNEMAISIDAFELLDPPSVQTLNELASASETCQPLEPIPAQTSNDMALPIENAQQFESMPTQSTAVIIFRGVQETIQNLMVTVGEKAKVLWCKVLELARTHTARYLRLVVRKLQGKPLTWTAVARAAFCAFVQLILDANWPDISPIVMHRLEDVVSEIVTNMSEGTPDLRSPTESILAFVQTLSADLFYNFMQNVQ